MKRYWAARRKAQAKVKSLDSVHGAVVADMGIALINAAMHHNNSATHSGARPSALNTAHAVDRRTIASERHSTAMRSPLQRMHAASQSGNIRLSKKNERRARF
jgi:hypothetical protein